MEIIECKGRDFYYYAVKENDDLYSITQALNVSQKAIVRNNPNIDFYEGEVIKVLKEYSISHIVKPMETLTSIAQKYNTTAETLVRTNNLKSDRLFIGQIININNP